MSTTMDDLQDWLSAASSPPLSPVAAQGRQRPRRRGSHSWGTGVPGTGNGGGQGREQELHPDVNGRGGGADQLVGV